LLANILIEPGRVELREIKTPSPHNGEMLVEIKAALTCGTDLKAFKRGHPVIPMPGVFGHEFSGIVASVGKKVKEFKEGDEIMAVHSAPCLECSYCKRKLYNLCDKLMDTKVLGTFAEYILLPPHIVKQNVFLKPGNLTFEEAAFLEPLSCVVHGIDPLYLKEGDYALIIGAGPIGLLHLLLLKEKSAVVTVIDKHRKKLKIAKDLGADFVFTSENFDKVIPLFGKGGRGGIFRTNKFANFIGFDFVFECTGIPEVWESSVNYARKGGTVILFGGCKSGTTVTYDTGKLHYGEITLKGVFHFTPADVRRAYELLCEGKLGVSRLISDRYPLSQTQKAFDKLARGLGIKYAIIPSK
jgi:L-iditol 2-dehydrogenase